MAGPSGLERRWASSQSTSTGLEKQLLRRTAGASVIFDWQLTSLAAGLLLGCSVKRAANGHREKN
jgi:hypothetical protein